MAWKVINNYFPSQIINQRLRHLGNTLGFPHSQLLFVYCILCCREASTEDSLFLSLSAWLFPFSNQGLLPLPTGDKDKVCGKSFCGLWEIIMGKEERQWLYVGYTEMNTHAKSKCKGKLHVQSLHPGLKACSSDWC